MRWSGGTLDISSSSPWIWAMKSGSAIKSDNAKTHIQQHDNMGTFTFDLQKATGGDSSNPFLDASTPSGSDPSSTGSSSGPSSTGRNGWGPFGWGPYGPNGPNGPNGGNGNSGNSGDNGNGGSNSGSSGSSGYFGTTPQKLQSIRTAHCVIMSLTFLVLLPGGALLMRAFSFPALTYVHASAQLFSLTLALSGFALGVWYVRTTKQAIREQPHYILGTTVIAMLLLQPVFGLIHHGMYRRYEKRTAVTHLHVWYGRLIFVLALTNGALGLKLGKSMRGGMEAATIAYSVVAAIMATLYISVLLLAWRKGGKTVAEKSRDQHRAERRLGSISGNREE
ncbi:hypothetical protein GP486_006360 [Trichoglossum hirsutum]|uniref:Cytochrome b561 domain-containing protein n=1 Tax=Trichoglossum hirsutum TaxID=265104 RepID=A0A9P8IEM1_9PEZI|nr:hypothetical protein GP486_006360 [Trichoglossum hirsutum]